MLSLPGGLVLCGSAMAEGGYREEGVQRRQIIGLRPDGSGHPQPSGAAIPGVERVSQMVPASPSHRSSTTRS